MAPRQQHPTSIQSAKDHSSLNEPALYGNFYHFYLIFSLFNEKDIKDANWAKCVFWACKHLPPSGGWWLPVIIGSMQWTPGECFPFLNTQGLLMIPGIVTEHKWHSSEISSVPWAICIYSSIQWEIHHKQKFAAVSPDFNCRSEQLVSRCLICCWYWLICLLLLPTIL